MLAVSPLTNTKKKENEMESYSFADLFDDMIDFDDLFLDGGDLLPDLEMDPQIISDELSESNFTLFSKFQEEEKAAGSGSGSEPGSGSSSLIQGDEIMSKRENRCKEAADKAKKSSSKSKNYPGKRKLKVDWTPELHKRFVQAVEQLGVDKAVPSRILELMGIHCLTRHNIASHLQKYRSHRRNVQAREAKATSWSQRRQIYGGVPGKINVKPWIAPTMAGFRLMTPPTTHFRPLYVWGHPSVDQSLMHTWPQHLAPPYAWPPAQLSTPPAHHSFWYSQNQHRFSTPPVPGIPSQAMYKVDPDPGFPSLTHGPRPPSNCHPSKESVDAAIGDVLSKPWLSLPLGLKPPSIESVMVELQSHGISKIPPTCT
ncbi:hypothetical protein ACJIZ3_010701 [Penstemon smallii]|uniref:HTH myb-type domain-containing protein n=1 Tax=Penstemon smallii TaxID=265156 RepID=A0ABD3UH24_9LAMI